MNKQRSRSPREDRGERGERDYSLTPDGRPKHVPNLLGKSYFQRKKSCPFSGPRGLKLDYKDAKMLGRFISDYGKILPSHITGVNPKNQRALAIAVKRARILALLPYSNSNQS
jgi:small subunit ribosomal protein S18